MKAVREINRDDYELYDLLENYFADKNYPNDIKKLVDKLLNTMKEDFYNKADQSYMNNKNDIVDVKDYEELIFRDGTTFKREIMFDVFMLYSILSQRRLTFDNLSEEYQDMVWELFRKVEDYENEKSANPKEDIVDIKYYKEVELED